MIFRLEQAGAIKSRPGLTSKNDEKRQYRCRTNQNSFSKSVTARNQRNDRYFQLVSGQCPGYQDIWLPYVA